MNKKKRRKKQLNFKNLSVAKRNDLDLQKERKKYKNN